MQRLKTYTRSIVSFVKRGLISSYTDSSIIFATSIRVVVSFSNEHVIFQVNVEFISIVVLGVLVGEVVGVDDGDELGKDVGDLLGLLVG